MSKKRKKKKNPPQIHKDHVGEYIKRQYFFRGKMKFEKIYVINGIPADEFYKINADPLTLWMNGDYEELYEKGY